MAPVALNRAMDRLVATNEYMSKTTNLQIDVCFLVKYQEVIFIKESDTIVQKDTGRTQYNTLLVANRMCQRVAV